MINSLKKIFNKKNTSIFVLVFVAFFMVDLRSVFAAAPAPLAAVGNTLLGGVGAAVSLVVGLIAYLITTVLGLMISLFISILIDVAQYSNIVDVPTVVNGWVIVRDLCNMFFILVLLIIAFATILRYEEYSAKRLLPKLLVMAVLINFSRTIFGLMIDFSQVVMLTFVNAFSSGGGWFIRMFQVDFYLKIADSNTYTDTGTFAVTTWSTAAAIIAGLIASMVTLIVVVVFVAVLMMRIIMLWIYTILSPLVFMGFAVPGIQKHTNQIWQDFIKLLVTGPLLAFFIWLALTTAQNSADLLKGQNISNQVCAGVGALFCTGQLQNYLIVIGLLMGGLMVAQQAGGAVGKAAGFAENWSKKGLKMGGTGLKNIGSFGIDKLSEKTGIDFNLVRGYHRLKETMADNERERSGSIYSKAISTAAGEVKEGKKPGYIRSKLAMASTGDLAWDEITAGSRGWRNLIMSNNWREKRKIDLIGEKDENGNYIKKGRITLAQEERDKVLTTAEAEATAKSIREKEKERTEKDNEIAAQTQIVNTAASSEEKDREKAKLNELKGVRKRLDSELSALNSKLSSGTVDDNKAKELDDNIRTWNKQVSTYEFEGMSEARAEASRAIEAEGAKKISSIEDPQQLVHMMMQALGKGQQGLVAAVAKKLTKQGNYNEFLRTMNLGTGYEGMIGFSNKLQSEGDFTRQAALRLTAEIGELAKSVKHFAGFGAVKLEHGEYTPATQDEAEAAQLNEMLKVQVQTFARDTGRLGLGYYQSGKPHTLENWVPSRSAIAFLKLNPSEKGKGLAGNIADTGQASGALHMAMNIDMLRKNGVPDNIIDAYTLRKGKAKDVNYQKYVQEVDNDKK